MKKVIVALITVVMTMSLVACGGPKGTFTYDLPEGFVKNEQFSVDGVEMYMMEGVSQGSNVNYYTTPDDGSFSSLTAELVMQEAEKNYKENVGLDVDIELVDSKKYKIEGQDAFRLETKYVLQGMQIKQIQVYVDGGKDYHIVTYTAGTEDDYYAEFVKSADNIRFE